MAPKASEEQVLYADILNRGMLIGLLGLVITFIIYGAGILDPKIPLDKVQEYWVMPVHEYLELTGIEAGWAWLGHLGQGDMLNFVPIALLAGLSIVCYLAVVPGLLRKGDKTYAALAIIEVIVLCVAASGILGSGGH